MRDKIIVIALAVVLLASVAYAAFSRTLQINGTSSISGDWDVHIDSITPTMGAGTANATAPVVGVDGLSATFDTTFAYPSAAASYDIAITNHGSINAEVSAIPSVATINGQEPVDVEYTIAGPAIGDQLHTGETVHSTVTVKWKSTGTTNPSTLSKSTTFSYGFIQSATQP
jgi:hypothetical protein